MRKGKSVTLCFHGNKVHEINIQTVAKKGIPQFHILGNAGREIRESIPKLKVAIEQCGCKFPMVHFTIHLSPQQIPKQGNQFDLPIAISLMQTLGFLEVNEYFSNAILLGELDLDGNVLPIYNLLELKPETLDESRPWIVPRENLLEAELLNHKNLYFIQKLIDIYAIFKKKENFHSHSSYLLNQERKPLSRESIHLYSNQILAYHALEIALAGRHHILITGLPGVGKTMLGELAEELQSLPIPSEYSDICKYHSYEGAKLLSIERPYRSPHHSITKASLLGGGSNVEIGEITKAHKGILFLDELGEIPSKIIQQLREPLEKKQYQLTRYNHSVYLDADFQFIATSNLCPCGYINSQENSCVCKKEHIREYLSKLSGPILDRIPIVIEIKKDNNFNDGYIKISLNESRKKINQVIQKQVIRNMNLSNQKILYNSSITEGMWDILNWKKEDIQKWEEICIQYQFSIREKNHTLSVARTIADLQLMDKVDFTQIYEAISLREDVKNIQKLLL